MTAIPYIDKTYNVVTGCSGKGCKAHCWVPPSLKRFPAIHGFLKPLFKESSVEPLAFEQVQFHPDRLDQPLHWRKPRRIGVCFTGDLFDEQVENWMLDRVFDRVFYDGISHHTFFILTKQVQNMAKYFSNLGMSSIPDNVYLGISACDQPDLDRMLPDLWRIPGKKWLSLEPLLGHVEIGKDLDFLDWLVIGCESGPKRRPCPIENMVSVVEQCQAASVPLWVKQIDLPIAKINFKTGKTYGKTIVCHDINLFPEALKVRQLPCAI